MDGNLTLIAAEQVGVMFLLILTGFIAARVGAVKAESRAALSDLLMNIVLPAMIINSYITEFDPSILNNLVKAVIASFGMMGVAMVASVLVCLKNKDPDMPLIRYAMAAGNCGYMGFPLISALFGNEGLLYASIFNTAYNIYVWTIGVRSLEKEKSRGGLNTLLELIKKPALVAVFIGIVIYLAQIPVPEIIHQPIELLGNMNTPLSMFITGMIMAEGGVFRTAKDKRLWETVFMRLIVCPALALLFGRITGIGGMVGAVTILLSGCPCASFTSVFAVRYHYDESLAAGLVVISTLLSIFTLPLLASFI